MSEIPVRGLTLGSLCGRVLLLSVAKYDGEKKTFKMLSVVQQLLGEGADTAIFKGCCPQTRPHHYKLVAKGQLRSCEELSLNFKPRSTSLIR